MEYVFSALRATQSGQDYFITACRLGLLGSLFPEDAPEDPLGGGIRPTLDRTRVAEIARYVTDHLDCYVFSPLTASVHSTVRFDTDAGSDAPVIAGYLRIPMRARFTLLDGRYRCAALKLAVQQAPSLRDESIGVVLFVDPKLERTEQIYVDLKHHVRNPSRSDLVLHDGQDKLARVTRRVIREVPV